MFDRKSRDCRTGISLRENVDIHDFAVSGIERVTQRVHPNVVQERPGHVDIAMTAERQREVLSSASIAAPTAAISGW
jgi:hypothetical protein